MGNLWIYIRTLFEEKYSKKENPFRCVIESVNNGKSRCICIPCVAVNYIAHQMKFCTKTPAGFNIWDMEWNSEYETYFIKKNSSDWNIGIPDLNSIEGNNSFDKTVQFCPNSPNGYMYIKIREFEDIKSSTIDVKKWYYEQEGEAKEKEITTVFIILAREFRTELDIKEYVEVLFRFSFFLHPSLGMNVLEQDLSKQSEGCGSFNANLLKAYCEMIKELKKSEFDSLERLNIISGFVGVDISKLYLALKESNMQGDIRGIDEYFQERLNITKKIAKGRRLKTIMDRYQISFQ